MTGWESQNVWGLLPDTWEWSSCGLWTNISLFLQWADVARAPTENPTPSITGNPDPTVLQPRLHLRVPAVALVQLESPVCVFWG